MSVDEAALGRLNTAPLIAPSETVHDYVRYALVKRALGAVTTETPQRIVAIGPEGGLDALWLASQGHDVTLADPRDNRLGNTRKRVRRFASRLGSNLHMELMTVDDLLTEEGEGSYDLALCHGSATYDSEPGTLISNAGKLVRPGGHLSVLEKGFDGVFARLILNGKYHEANNLQRTFRARDGGRKGWAFRPRWLRHALRDAGALSFEWYGVCVTRSADTRRVHDITAEELEAIVVEQELAGNRHDLRGSATLLHFIGRIGVPTLQ